MSNIFELPDDPAEMMSGLKKNRNRDDLKADILVGLGAPTIRVELTDEQLDQAINSALRQFWTNHRDGSFENFYFVELTEQQVAQGWIQIPENIDAIIEVLPKGFGRGDEGFANWEWQMAAAALPGASGSSVVAGSSYSVATPGTSGGVAGSFGGVQKLNTGMLNQFGFADYMLAKQAMDTVRYMTGSDVNYFNFVRYQRRMYPRFPVRPGEFIAFRCYENVDPDKNPELFGELFDDEMLKNLATANAKIIWGSVLRKFGGIQLPGGVTLEGDSLIAEGREDSEQLIKEMQDMVPADFFIG